MPRPLCVLPALALAFAALPALAQAPVPLVLNQQGRLLTATDAPVNGKVAMKVALYDTNNPNVHTPVWSQQQEVQVVDGFYSVTLGEPDPIEQSLFTKPELFLSVTIDGSELLPRLRVASAPYALRAGHAATAEKVVAGSIDTQALADASVTLAKLSLTGGKFVNLDADLLDGLDSSAFAPAAIESTVDDIQARVTDVQAKLENLDGKVATAASITALDEKVASAAALSSLDAKAATSAALATLDTKVTQLAGTAATATTVAATKTSLDTLLARSKYSSDCRGSDTGWENRVDCLADGRWHVLANEAPTDKNGDGITQQAETCEWIVKQLTDAGLVARGGVWEVMFSYDANVHPHRGFFRAQDAHNLTLWSPGGTITMHVDNYTTFHACSLGNNGAVGYKANLSVKL